MIEVTLAIAIVALGMTGIVSLFPVGFQSTRDSIGDNYVNDASQLFLSYIKLAVKKDPVPLDQAHIDSQWITTMSTIPNSRPDSDGSGETTETFTKTIEMPNVRYCPTNGLYRVYQGSTGIDDFTAAVRVWKTPVVSPIHTNSWGKWDPPDSVSCGINIEFSWPVEKPYAMRTKRFFYYELFKPKFQ